VGNGTLNHEVQDALHVGIHIGYALAVQEHYHRVVLQLNDAEQVRQIEVVHEGCVDAEAARGDRLAVAAVGGSYKEERCQRVAAVGIECDGGHGAEDGARLVGGREVAELAHPHVGGLIEEFDAAEVLCVSLDIDHIPVAGFLRPEGIDKCVLQILVGSDGVGSDELEGVAVLRHGSIWSS